ncbi:hypothetical protein B0H14DRAFT_3517846 [Mycena olivaceomarginata]|nr:hypothetical protein B0H14DRAFT_3517846 [Mycena olivaceomarginata]
MNEVAEVPQVAFVLMAADNAAANNGDPEEPAPKRKRGRPSKASLVIDSVLQT